MVDAAILRSFFQHIGSNAFPGLQVLDLTVSGAVDEGVLLELPWALMTIAQNGTPFRLTKLALHARAK